MAAASSEAPDTDDIMPLPPPFRGEHKAIILWDLDETLIALRSQLKNREAVQTVAMMEKLLEDYLDDVFHFRVVEEFDPENVCDHLSPEQLASEQQRGANVQTQAAEELAKDLVKYLEYAVAAYATDSVSTSAPSVVWWQDWQKHLNNLDTFCNQWTAQAQKILAYLKDKGCLHMAVTNTRLVAALAKLKLWGLSSFFEPQWIYSSSHRGKQAVFCRALQAAANAGIGSEIVLAVGDGPEEEAASRTYQLPFIKIFSADDLERVVDMVESKLSPPLQSQAQAQADVLAVVNEIDKAQRDKPHTQAKQGGATTTEADSGNAEDDSDLYDAQSNKRLRRGSFEVR